MIGGMSEPTAYLLALRASTADLIKQLTALHWSDADVAAPSLCPGWTRGHVLTHLARNADGISDTLAGALRGELVKRYPGGWDARNAAIDEGAGRPYAALLVDVRESAERLDRVLGAIGDADGWGLPTDQDSPAEAWVYRRWREVEIHRVDLAADYTPEAWPPLFVGEMLADAISALDERVSGGAVRVVVAEDGSVVPDLVGKQWTAGSGEPVEVRGPDWAILAWLVGRDAVVGDALSAAPALSDWS
jgi:maleylpyruvate isomerase